jgi:hypothetical protein
MRDFDRYDAIVWGCLWLAALVVFMLLTGDGP